ncbi:Pro-interleukin-16 [Strongyloides ratti]|uniref:Pro-interleukin-16 n=1 Tax=Strongyloides ratti TaxID=34506 RepID=A0A090MZ61_STRRB|nr:Pro-interleukin-16 [Strongyloides ratti]CEF68374.1 Pro-interleukin-16 [Strongyloides ratti]
MSNLKKINLKKPPSTTSRNGQIIQTIILYRNFEDTSPFNTKIKKDNSCITNQQNFKKNFGFSIVGGIDSPKGALGIFVKTICQHGVASRSGLLEPGDEILSVNGVSLRGKTHEESVKILKKYGRCSLVLTIAKNNKNKSSDCSSIYNKESSICSNEISNKKLDFNSSFEIYQSCNQEKINNIIEYDNEIKNFNNINVNISTNNEKTTTLEEEEQYYQVIFEDENEKTFDNKMNNKINNSICPYSNFYSTQTKKTLKPINNSLQLTTTPTFYNSFSLTKKKRNSLSKIPSPFLNRTKKKDLKNFYKSTNKSCCQQQLNFCHHKFNDRKNYLFGSSIKKIINNLLNNNNNCTMQRVVILKRDNSKERLGLGVAIESDEEDERVLCVTVEQVDEDSISYIQGLAPGDRIWQINGIDVHKCKRIECLSLFQCAPLLLNLVVSTPYKKISKTPLYSDIISNNQPYLELRNHNHLPSEKYKNIKEDNQEVLESEYQTITTESESSFDKLPLSLSNIPQYLTTDYLCETVNYQMSSRKTDQPSINAIKMLINHNMNKIEDKGKKDYSLNSSNDIIKKDHAKEEVQNTYSPTLSLINTFSSTSSISPDPHSPTHSEDSGFQNDHATAVKSKNLLQISTSPVPVRNNSSKISTNHTTSTSPTRYRSVFARTQDSVDIEKNIFLSEEGKSVDEISKCTKSNLNDNKMFNGTIDCFIKAKNSNTLYGYMDCKMSKSQPLVLKKIILSNTEKSGPVVPPKPKLSSENNSSLLENKNCLKDNKIFSRASVIHNSENCDVKKESTEDGTKIIQQEKIKPKVLSLIQKFQTGNIVHEDSDEEIENISLKGDNKNNSGVLFETNKDSTGEIILQEDFLIEQDRCLETIINSQNINNKINTSLPKREISNEKYFTFSSEEKFKSLAEKYREPTPTKEVISPALKVLLEKDFYNSNNISSSSSSSTSRTNLLTKSEDSCNTSKDDELLPNITTNSSTYSSRNSTPIPTIEKFSQLPPSSYCIEKKEEYNFAKTITSTTNNEIIESNKQHNFIEKCKPIKEQNVSPLLGIGNNSNSSRLSNNQKMSPLNLTKSQIEELQEILKDQYGEYEFFVVNMTRVAGITDGSVGIILTAAESTSNLSTITVQRVITGSVADREGTLLKGDRLFFIQGKSTMNMSAADARRELKAPAQIVTVVAGRLNKFKVFRVSSSLGGSESDNVFTGDPNMFTYSDETQTITLIKNTIGVGFSLDGGVDSSFGNRPIIIKRLFNGGEALKSGLITVGDILEKVEDTSLEGMTYLDAWKMLKTLPEGKVRLCIRKIQK